TTALPASRFMAINALAAVVWATVFVTLGYLFGQGIEAAFGRVRDVGHVLVPVLAVLLLVGLVAHLRHRRREVTARD
ncbi:MAG TPA: hypothetical protein VF499_09000, partial [Afipia sp.]